MKAIFDKVIDRIIQLVQHQIQITRSGDTSGAPITVLLAGGFGQCQYLGDRLRNEQEQRFQDIDVLVSPRS